MSVRFVIGRAGMGKTHHCLTSIRTALRDDPLGDTRLVLLAPEQASLQMEQALLSDEMRATARAEVLSFRRLAYRVLEAAGVPDRHVLSGPARAMVLRALYERVAPRLRYYKRVDRLPGFFDRIGETIGELMEEAVNPADLRTLASDGETEQQQSAKLLDIGDLYESYCEYLGDSRLDASQYLQLAREAISGVDYLQGARIWVDGFAGFTGQELRLLCELADRAAAVDVTLLLDPAGWSVGGGLESIDPADLFARSQRTYVNLRDVLRERGIAIDEPLVLSPPSPLRFDCNGSLARVEAAFVADSVDPLDGSEVGDGSVKLVEVVDRRTEVEFAVAQVCDWVWQSNGKLRYRDVAIIVRDFEPYHDLLAPALSQRNIPYFLDRRRPIAHHPLVEFIRAALSVASTSYGVESIRLALKTGLCGLEDAEADILENYVLAHGITGIKRWTGSDWTYPPRRREGELSPRDRQQLASINHARRRFVDLLGRFAALAADPRRGSDWMDALRDLLEKAGAEEAIESWATREEDDGDADSADEHRQALGVIEELLDDLGDALADFEIDLPQLAAIMEAALSGLTIGLVPPTLDQVLVGSIERSRHPDIKATVVLGFNDGVFPLAASEGAILTDEDRSLFSGRDMPIGATRKQRLLDEAILAYVAVTRPSEQLVVTWAASDAEGKALRLSPYAAPLRRALPAEAIRSVGDPVAGRQTWPVLTGRDLAASLSLEMRNRPALSVDRTEMRGVWNDLYVFARASDELRSDLSDALVMLVHRNEARLQPGSVLRLIPGTYTASVTELESFAACPFQRFARYGLRLKERWEADLDAVDVGSIHHAILEDFLNGSLQRKEDLAGVSEGDIQMRLQESAERIGANLLRDGELSGARDTYMLDRSAADLSSIVSGQQRILAAGRFRPGAAEKKFGFAEESSSLPPLEIDTPLGRKVFVRGSIDRVDLAELADEMVGIVVDYKRTRDKRLDLADVHHGLSLQLLGYLLALAQHGKSLADRPVIPAGAFYVSLLQKYRAVDHPDDAPDMEDGTSRGPIPRGLFDAGRLDLLETNPELGQSPNFAVFRKKDGTLGRIDSSDATESGAFAAVLEHTRQRIGELADGVLDGDVSVAPYRLKGFSPCGWCKMRAVCRFEFGDHGMRHLENLSRKQVLDRLEGGA